MKHSGKVLNGPLAGRHFIGQGAFYDFGGIGVRLWSASHTPFGTILWREDRQGWEWHDREPLPIEEAPELKSPPHADHKA